MLERGCQLVDPLIQVSSSTHMATSESNVARKHLLHVSRVADEDTRIYLASVKGIMRPAMLRYVATQRMIINFGSSGQGRTL